MLSVDTSQLRVKEPLPGWKGRFFKSANMTFGYYSVSAGASIHEHSHASEEVWHVIEGDLEVSNGRQTQVTRAGCVALVPPDALDSYGNIHTKSWRADELALEEGRRIYGAPAAS